MMKCVWSSFLVLMLVSPAFSQDLDTILSEFKSTDPDVRRAAFYQIPGITFANNPDAQTAVISLLNTENSFSQSLSDLSEEYTDYYGNLVSVVASLKDIRALPGLLSVIDTGSMAMDGVAAFGSAALDGLRSTYTSQDVTVRNAVILTINEMLTTDNGKEVSDSLSKGKIRELLFQSSGDSNADVKDNTKETVAIFDVIDTSPWDVNGDGKVDCSDLAIVKAEFGKRLGQANFDPRADVNGDGVVNVKDLASVAQHLPAGTKCQ